MNSSLSAADDNRVHLLYLSKRQANTRKKTSKISNKSTFFVQLSKACNTKNNQSHAADIV